MLITYENDQETIVCTLEEEHIVLSNYFNEGNRDLDDYDRTEHKNNILSIDSRLYVNSY